MDEAPYPVQSIGPPPIPSSQSCTTTQHPAEYHSLYLKIGFRFSDGLLRMKAFRQKNAENMFLSQSHLDAVLMFSEQKKT